MIVLLVGPQGAGKGTVAERLSKESGLVHISTGDLLRAEAKSGSDLGKKLAAIMEAGGLVDDNLMLDILEKRLAQPDAKMGVLLDGFPRTVPQAKALNDRVIVDCVIQLTAPDEVVIARISNRWQCRNCGTIYGVDVPPKTAGICDKCQGELYQRKDDQPDAVKKRLATYYKETEPILALYTDLIKKVDASRKLDVILQDCRQALADCRNSDG